MVGPQHITLRFCTQGGRRDAGEYIIGLVVEGIGPSNPPAHTRSPLGPTSQISLRMSQTTDNQPMRVLFLSSRCLFNTQFIDSDTKEVLYSTRTPKVWFTRQSVTSVVRHAPSTKQPSGSESSSPVTPPPTSPSLVEKISVQEDASSELTKLDSLPHCTPGEEKDGVNEAEITKIHWKFFHDTLFEQELQTKDVNQLMEKSGCRPLRFDRTFKVNGIGYKWDLGLVGFDAPKLKMDDDAETVVAKFHRTCCFGTTKLTLELRPGSEDILDMIVMTLVWVQWRQRLRMFTMVPTAAMLL
ncbi:hypothetical protein BJ322DRAFT_1208148 [Thelephora terrestris]|uniref:DUF6593 domain-containing protein n=1 Tax=Thelephora terrestris TaxID=56493 RepID=A0A9P6HMJ8_9AGAM|nr:hypothetical protein BJ322DRAFT_1208148 [Thelephora terrestris]